ncbi:MAG: TIGR01212 family radical SAM protein [Clostridiaceae bacterium]|nr:TIGR01212 family radical SAM protein [Clostridiaceae bacterium]
MFDSEKKRYNVYSKYLKKKYGEKVYKLPVNIPVTCPNRDGTIGYGGCIFCGEEGAGFEILSNALSVSDQLKTNMEYIRKKYNTHKFIAYFQNFSNTYLSLDKFKSYIREACVDNVVEISISTRPDCVSEEYLLFLDEIRREKNVEISLELGLQTVNYHSLIKINRGHTLAEFIDAVLRIRKYNFVSCAHVILNLPWDLTEDVIETAKIISALEVNQVKLHSLYIVKGTAMEKMYLQGDFKIISVEEYIDRVILFLEYLNPQITVQRLIGRAPEENTLFVNWGISWWKIRDKIEEEMEKRNTYQGKHFDYLNGKALQKWAIER